MFAFAPSLVSICCSAATPAAVGIRIGEVCAPALARKRFHCGVAKKKSLSFLIGPPRENPNVLVICTGIFVVPRRPCSAGMAERAEGCMMSQPEPCQVLVPPL